MNTFKVSKITLVSKDKLRAMVSVIVADSVFLTGIRVIEGSKGLFVAMPSKKDVKGEYHDIFFPASKTHRDELQALILQAYADAGGAVGAAQVEGADYSPAGSGEVDENGDIPF